MRAAVFTLDANLDWHGVACRGAESAVQLEALLSVPQALADRHPASAAYDRALDALWQLIRRLNEERSLPDLQV